MEWAPNQEQLAQVVGILSTAVSSASTEENRAVTEVHNRSRVAKFVSPHFQAIDSYSNNAEFNQYLVFVLAHAHDVHEEVRQMAGLIIKKNSAHFFHIMPPAVQEYVKHSLLACLVCDNGLLRMTAANSVSTIMRQVQPQGWPQAVGAIIEVLSSGSADALDGVFRCLNQMCEDLGENLEKEVEGIGRPLDQIIPQLLRYLEHPHFRQLSLESLLSLASDMPPALSNNLDAYMQALSTLATDDNSEIRRLVCSSLTALVYHRVDAVLPHIASIVPFLLHAGADEDDDVAIAANEFWPPLLNRARENVGVLQPYLKQLVEVLLTGMKYSEEELALLPVDDVADAGEPDRAEDIRPIIHSSSSHGAVDGDEDDDLQAEDDEDASMAWTRRRACAVSMDKLASTFEDELLEHLMDPVQALLHAEGDDIEAWRSREAGVLAMGAVAKGCSGGLTPYLPDLLGFFRGLMADTRPLVRTIACWVQGQYAAWMVEQDDADALLETTLESLLQRLGDHTKKVQEAACSALVKVMREYEDKLEHYCHPIAHGLMQAYGVYQAKNLLFLYDAIGTFAELLGPAVMDEAVLGLMMPPLIEKWETLSNNDVMLIPLLECLGCIVMAAGSVFGESAGVILQRCLQIVQEVFTAVEEGKAAGTADPVSIRDMKEFAVAAIDLISSMVEGIGGDARGLMEGSNINDLLRLCLQDEDSEIRQSTLSLVGELAKYAVDLISPDLSNIVTSCAMNLRPALLGCCNNACWAIGEIVVAVPEVGHTTAPALMDVLAPIMAETDLDVSLLNNAAITIGRLAMCNAAAVAAHFDSMARQWCYACGRLSEDIEKEHAFQGLCLTIHERPDPMAPLFGLLCRAIGTWQSPRDELMGLMQQTLAGMKEAFGPGWEAEVGKLPSQLQNMLQTHFGL